MCNGGSLWCVTAIVAAWKPSVEYPVVILGIDPGTATTGVGVIRHERGQLAPIYYGVVRTVPEDDTPTRIRQVYDEVGRLMDLHEPDYLATERLFFSKNETTAFGVGRTIGVVLLAASQRGIPWQEYTPMQVKQAVVGYGGADKRQVQFMISRLLGLAEAPRPDDAADALAVAVCHAHSSGPTGPLGSHGRRG